MILDQLTAKNITLFVFFKIFIYNLMIDTQFCHQMMAIFISLVFIGFGWLLMWLYVLQRFKMIRELVNEFVIK